jgi:hypothetical protein
MEPRGSWEGSTREEARYEDQEENKKRIRG